MVIRKASDVHPVPEDGAHTADGGKLFPTVMLSGDNDHGTLLGFDGTVQQAQASASHSAATS